MHGEAKGPRPIAGVRVVLHRVGADNAGPLDSMLTDARGRYHFQYAKSGSPDAIYFVSASFDGIAYFSVPLKERFTHGDDAAITVFDTTSGPVPIHILGHHIIIGAPDPQGKREAVEVFELGNDSSVTRVSGGRDRPVWTAQLPNKAVNPKVNPSGEVAPSAVWFADRRVRLYAPVSPGARQLSYAYQLPRDALPLSISIDQPTSVLEVLLEEPKATVSGTAIAEVAPTTTAGRSFRRFLGPFKRRRCLVLADGFYEWQHHGRQSQPFFIHLQSGRPFTLADTRSVYFIAVATVCGLAMLAAIVVAARRRPVIAANAARAHVRPTEDLLQAIATLDVRFETEPPSSAGERAAYESERAQLKSRLAAALAEERQGR